MIEQTIFSDHIILNDFPLWESLAEKHFGNKGQDFNKHTQNKIEAFLKDYLKNDTVFLKRVIFSADAATGFPIWGFEIEFERQ